MPKVPENLPVYYVINFKNGMAYHRDPRRIKEIVTSEQEVSIMKAISPYQYIDMLRKYVSDNFVPGVIEVLPVFDYNVGICWKDSRHQPAPKRSSRRFFVNSISFPRMGYFTSVDKMLAALYEGPPDIIVYEVSGYDEAVKQAQLIIAREVLSFSGYFDKNAGAPPVLCELPTNSLISCYYRKWMAAHCVLPPELQEYSFYGCATPESAPDQYSPLFNIDEIAPPHR